MQNDKHAFNRSLLSLDGLIENKMHVEADYAPVDIVLLVIQLKELNKDLVLCLNLMDEAKKIYEEKENNIKAIGVDMPNNYLAPQHVITSALKNVGEGLRLTIKDYVEGNFTSGEVKYNSSNGGVGFEKTDLLSDEVIKFVEDRIK